MTPDSSAHGTSFFSALERYWVKRPVQKPLLHNETLIVVSPEHWIKYVFPTFLYVVMMIGGLLLLYGASTGAASASLFLLILALLLLFIAQHWFFWFLLGESQAHIILTNKRVVHIRESLLWREEMVEVTFDKMKTVESHKKNLLQAILNYGTLQFEKIMKVDRVPHPGTLAKEIEQAMGMV